MLSSMQSRAVGARPVRHRQWTPAAGAGLQRPRAAPTHAPCPPLGRAAAAGKLPKFGRRWSDLQTSSASYQMHQAAAAPGYVAAADGTTLSDMARTKLNAEELLAFVEQYAAELSGPDCAAICNHLAKITDRHKMTVNNWSSTHALLRSVTRLMEERWSSLRGQDYLYTIAAMAKLRFQPRLAWINAFLGYSRRRLEAAGPGHLTIYLRSLACLHMQPWDIKACQAFGPWVQAHLQVTRGKLRAFTPQELTKVICALADLGYRPDDEWLQAYSAAVTSRLYAYDASFLAKTMAAFSQLQFMPGHEFMRKYYSEMNSRLPLFDDQDLADTISAFSALHALLKQDFLDDFLASVHQKLAGFEPRPLANVLYALGRMRTQVPQQWLDDVAQHVHQNLRRFPPASMCYAMLGLARLGLPPRQALLDDFIAASYAKIPNFTAHEFTHAAQALAAWRYAPSDAAAFARWWERFTYSMEKRSFEPRLVCDIVAAFAALGRAPDELVLQDLLLQVKDVGLFHVPPESLKQLLVALHALGHQPGQSWLYYYAQMARFWWTNMSGGQFGAVFRTLAAMGHKPDSVWWADMLARLQCRCDTLDAQSLTDVLVGVARFGAATRKQPSGTWLRHMAARLQELLGSCTAVQLAEALPALVQLQLVPSQQWVADVSAAVSAMQVDAAEREALLQHLAGLDQNRPARLTGGSSTAAAAAPPAMEAAVAAQSREPAAAVALA